MMNIIYGEKNSRNIKQQYFDLSQNLGELVENVVYDTFWSRPGLSMKEKSLITLISLIALNKQEQLKRYLQCYINVGGEVHEMMRSLSHMKACQYASLKTNVDSCFAILFDHPELQTLNKFNSDALSARDKSMIDFAVCIALGDQSKTKKCVTGILELKTLSINEIESIMLHQIMYCGFPCAMNGFAILKGMDKKSDDGEMDKPKKSEMMDALYGKTMSEVVYARCHELSPVFNKLVQEVVYDIFWRRKGVPLIQKSLVTIVTLIALEKEEQLRIHLSGYLHLGATPNQVRNIFSHMEKGGYIESADLSNAILNEIIKENRENHHDDSLFLVDDADKLIIDLTASVAIGDREKINKSIKQALSGGFLKEDIENMMLHEMMYCGLPCALLGFSVLRECVEQA
jgi:alkylhydroperoxidase/carboxymuconolactone decarboxylase family protein YurZ